MNFYVYFSLNVGSSLGFEQQREFLEGSIWFSFGGDPNLLFLIAKNDRTSREATQMDARGVGKNRLLVEVLGF